MLFSKDTASTKRLKLKLMKNTFLAHTPSLKKTVKILHHSFFLPTREKCSRLWVASASQLLRKWVISSSTGLSGLHWHTDLIKSHLNRWHFYQAFSLAPPPKVGDFPGSSTGLSGLHWHTDLIKSHHINRCHFYQAFSLAVFQLTGLRLFTHHVVTSGS